MKTKLFFLTPVILNLMIFNLRSGNAQYVNNYAASFNGTNSYVAVPWHSELQPGSALTVEAWVYPTALPVNSACIIGKNYQTSYYFGIENTGRFVFIPKNSGSFLRSRVTGVVKVNQWTHIAGTYDGTFTRLYINGVLDTSRTGITGPVGSNFDSLFIGCDRFSGAPAYFFNGRLDNVRIWNSARTSTELFNNMFIPLSIYQLSGSYSYLSASYQFDNSAKDVSGPAQNNGTGRNISYVNYSDKAVNHLDYNNSLVLNGSTDYCSHYNIGDPINANSAITLECWIKRDTVSGASNDRYILNKSKNFQYDYSIQLYNSGALLFGINNGNNILFTSPLITNAQWTHIAATYSSITGNAAIYINGELKASGTFSGNPVINTSTTDTLFIGGRAGFGGISANFFKGQMDEVRIWRKSRTQEQIKEFMHKHPPYPTSLDDSLIIFDFDNLHSGFKIGATDYNYGLKYHGFASLSSAHTNSTKLSSPMLSDPDENFYNSSYTSSFKRFFIPKGDVFGTTDSILISGVGTVSNLKVYVLMSHPAVWNTKLILTSPTGTAINLLAGNGGTLNDVMTIFSDASDSTGTAEFSLLPSFGISAPFSPSIKPNQALSSLNGQSRNGWWKLKFIDQFGGSDIGYVHGWGINMKSYKTLNLTALPQGFYDAAADKMVIDTARMYLRIPLPPYPVFDSSTAVLDSNGNASFNFAKAVDGINYYLVFKHRNSIETWSASGIPFNPDTASYNFTTSSSQAFGNNQIQVDTSPARFAIYNADVNQDEIVDLGDIISVFNDASNFITGYVPTDVDGDNSVDLSDITLTFNNSNNFVSVIKP